MTALAALLALLAGWLARPARPSASVAPAGPDPARASGRMRRLRWLWSGAGAVGAWAFVGGPAGPVAGVVAGVAVWVVVSRAEDPAVRRSRQRAEQDLPHLVLLLAAALRGGAPPAGALAAVTAALPGEAATRLEGVRARLALGEDPVSVWRRLGDDPVLAPLGRSMATAIRSGARVAETADRLAVELRQEALARQEQRARTIGVRAAVPLGLCLLPAFLLIGIVPVVAGLFATLTSP